MLCSQYLYHIEYGWHLMNSSPPGAAYMRQWLGSALVQVMACRLFGTKPLPDPMLTFCHWDLKKQTSVKSNKNTKLFIQEYALKISSAEWRTFLSKNGPYGQHGHNPTAKKKNPIAYVNKLPCVCIFGLHFSCTFNLTYWMNSITL